MNGKPSKPDREGGVHFEYKVDLSDPTRESLENIKNDLVRKIAENVQAEQEGLGDVQLEMRSSHDRHYSIHSRD